jgi:hypothetical protein
MSGEILYAYLTTAYWVRGSEGEFAMQVGTRCDALEALFSAADCASAAFITAFNPFGEAASEEVNLTAQANLRERLETLGIAMQEGEGRGADGDWDPEPSFLALGLSFDQAGELGRALRQNAIIWVGADLIPSLVVLRGAEIPAPNAETVR